MSRMRTTEDVHIVARLAGMTAGLVRLAKNWEGREEAYRVESLKAECRGLPAIRAKYEGRADEVGAMRGEVEALLKEAGDG